MSRRCVVCDGPEPFAPVFERGGFTLVRCPSCGLVFQHPQPSPEAMAGLYYHDPEMAARLEGDLRDFAIARGREKLALLEGACVRPGGPLLDVGCSSGAWLEVAREAGWGGVGIEIGEAFVKAARSKGLEVYSGTLQAVAPSLSGRGFALITFWDVLEHLPDPLAALRIAAGLLAPGGRIALTAPNVAGLYPRATYRLLARRTGVWEYPEVPAHLYDFSPATAARLLERAGLSAKTVRTTAVPFRYYRDTALRDQLADRGAKGRALGWAFAALRALLYPVARLTDRGNALFVTAEHRRAPA